MASEQSLLVLQLIPKILDSYTEEIQAKFGFSFDQLKEQADTARGEHLAAYCDPEGNPCYEGDVKKCCYVRNDVGLQLHIVLSIFKTLGLQGNEELKPLKEFFKAPGNNFLVISVGSGPSTDFIAVLLHMAQAEAHTLRTPRPKFDMLMVDKVDYEELHTLHINSWLRGIIQRSGVLPRPTFLVRDICEPPNLVNAAEEDEKYRKGDLFMFGYIFSLIFKLPHENMQNAKAYIDRIVQLAKPGSLFLVFDVWNPSENWVRVHLMANPSLRLVCAKYGKVAHLDPELVEIIGDNTSATT